MAFAFNENNIKRVELAIGKYPNGRQLSAVMEILYIAQEQNGWISPDVMVEIGRILNISPVKVKEVATFYTMYYKEPVGKFVLQICGTTPCMLRGSHELLESVKKELKIEEGETTADGLFTLIEVECLGACSNAPVVQVNNYYYEDLTIDNMLNIIREIREGKLPVAGSFAGRKSAEPLMFIKR